MNGIGRNDALVIRTIRDRPDWLERIQNRLIDDQSGCQLWTRGTSADGYGQVHLPKEIATTVSGSTIKVYVHRVAWLVSGNTIPTGMVLDHLCRTRLCCNVGHLRVVTQGENTLAVGSKSPSAINAAKTTCPRGHPLAGDNLVPSYLTRGIRRCLLCQRRHFQRMDAAVRAAHMAVGLTRRQYVAIYGQSIATAQRIVTETRQP